jgi:putative ABC transport system permease protein
MTLAVRSRVLFKMGVRNFVRHRTHSALVIAGLLVGTAIISGAMVTGDSIGNSIVKGTYDSLGLVDVTVSSPQGAYFDQSIFWSVHNDTMVGKYADGIAPTFLKRISTEDTQSGQFDLSMELIGFDPELDAPFGPFTLLNGSKISGGALAPDEALINEKAAQSLNATTGDSLVVRYLSQGATVGMESTFIIQSIVTEAGKGGFGGTSNVFIRLETAQSMFNATGEINLIRISGVGDVRTGVDHSQDIVSAVTGVLASQTDPTAAGLGVKPVKQDSLDQAKQASDMITTFITIFGSISILAGIILIINIFTMLAEERKSELGMARAVGMTRRDLMKMFLFEGSTYAVAASAIGTFAGLALAYGLILGINQIFVALGTGGIAFFADVGSLVNAFCAGTIITFLTILFASWRVTRINIVRAIRDIEEPVVERASRATVLIGAVLGGFMALAFVLNSESLVVRYIAPCVTFMGMALMIRGFSSARIAFSLGGAGIMAYTLYAIADFFNGSSSDVPYLFIAAGVFLVLAAVMVVMFNSSLVVRMVSGTFGRMRSLRPIVKTAISHPLNKKFRTGSTVSMFTLVIFTIIMVSVFTGVFSLNVDDQVATQGGGYQILGTTQVPVLDISNASILNSQGHLVQITSPTLTENVQTFEQIALVLPTPAITVDGAPLDGNQTFVQQSVMAIDDHFIEHNQFKFTDISPQFSSPAEVWGAVRNNDTNVVFGGMTTFGAGGGVHAGSVISMPTAQGARNFTVVGVLDTIFMSGVIMTKEHAAALFSSPQTIVGNFLFLFQVKPGLDVQAVTYGLEKDFRMLGMNTGNIRETVVTMLNMINSIFLLFQAFLGLGLAVGVTGLGIITIRSVVERRREIGILRAIGFKRREILASFITETLFITTLSVIIGVAIGLVVSYEIFNSLAAGAGVTWSVPWGQLVYITAITYAVALACTIAPAFRASRIPPAEALRTNE